MLFSDGLRYFRLPPGLAFRLELQIRNFQDRSKDWNTMFNGGSEMDICSVQLVNLVMR